jgi:hypothetical protein
VSKDAKPLVDEVVAVVICQACGRPIKDRVVRHHVKMKSEGGSDHESNRVPREVICEAVCHIINSKGNPTVKQWGRYRKLRARFVGCTGIEPDLKQSSRLASLARKLEKKKLDHHSVSDRELVNTALD